MPQIEDIIQSLTNPRGVRFDDLLKLAITLFGKPRVNGSNQVFKMLWQGNPRINLQKDGDMAKPYRVKQMIGRNPQTQ